MSRKLAKSACDALGLLCPPTSNETKPAKRPNILYIHSHDTGRYIQPYGYAVPTPHMQRLAEQGMVFRQAFCAGPTCSPSRAGLLTGQCAHRSGMLGLTHRGFSLSDPNQHLAAFLGRNGYTTALCGFQHEARDPSTLGYQTIPQLPSRHVKDVAPAAVEYLRSRPAEPFFLSVGFTETHRLASAKGAFALTGPCGDGRYVRPPAPLPDTRQTRDDMADFIESAREYDRGVGMVLDALDQAGLAENTLVINTTDHGVPFPALKCHLTDHGIGVMCILRGPGGFSGGKVCDAMVSQIDLFPTLCELAGLEEPDWLEGRSLAPLARGEIEQVRQAVFSEVTYHAAYEPQRCVRTQRWKYIRRYGDRVKPVLSNMDEGLSKSYLREHGLADRTIAQEQLYDLCFDPNEVNNLAGDPARASVLEEMRNRLAQWMEATSDPLLQGPVPAPAGAIVSSQDDATPDDVDNRRKKKG